MIVVEITLVSAIHATRDRELGTLIIANTDVSEDGRRGDYRCRMYRKGEMERSGGTPRTLVSRAPKPIRECTVKGHRRLAEPVQNLVAKALKEMGYE